MSDAVTEIDGATLDPETFGEITQACAPRVIRGLCATWEIVERAAAGWASVAGYLAELDVGRPAEAFRGEAAIAGRYHYGEGLDGFNFARETLPFGEALARISASAADDAAASWYMGSLPAEDFLPGFAARNPIAVIGKPVPPRVWIGNASQIACHYDMYDNLACVAAGHRRFTLFPPDCIGDLYVGPIDFTMAGQPVSLAAGAPEGDRRYPRFAKARAHALTVELAPGDALYLPKLWWHQVAAIDPANVLVNYWWDGFKAGADAPYTTMMLAMIAIAERPKAERAAWRAFFDHYVFRPDGHPLAHLPADKHGILGPLGAGNYGRIRALVMQMLRGG